MSNRFKCCILISLGPIKLVPFYNDSRGITMTFLSKSSHHSPNSLSLYNNYVNILHYFVPILPPNRLQCLDHHISLFALCLHHIIILLLSLPKLLITLFLNSLFLIIIRNKIKLLISSSTHSSYI